MLKAELARIYAHVYLYSWAQGFTGLFCQIASRQAALPTFGSICGTSLRDRRYAAALRDDVVSVEARLLFVALSPPWFLHLVRSQRPSLG